MNFVECNENILDKRTEDVSKLLDKLRSVSMTDHQVSKLTNDASSSYGDWKVWFFFCSGLQRHFHFCSCYFEPVILDCNDVAKKCLFYSWNMILKIAVLCTVKGSMEVLFTLCSLKVTWMGLSTNVISFLITIETADSKFNDASAGYINLSFDAGLCVSWETSLYKKWWESQRFWIVDNKSHCLVGKLFTLRIVYVYIGGHSLHFRHSGSWKALACKRSGLVNKFA